MKLIRTLAAAFMSVAILAGLSPAYAQGLPIQAAQRALRGFQEYLQQLPPPQPILPECDSDRAKLDVNRILAQYNLHIYTSDIADTVEVSPNSISCEAVLYHHWRILYIISNTGGNAFTVQVYNRGVI